MNFRAASSNRPDRCRGGLGGLLPFAARRRKRSAVRSQRLGMVKPCRLSTVFYLLLAATSFAQPEASPPQWQTDAELTAVTFVDADRGWAVGDRGVIWHTGDGGR